jgi:hypothetical protein
MSLRFNKNKDVKWHRHCVGPFTAGGKNCLGCWLKITNRNKTQNWGTNEEAMKEGRTRQKSQDRWKDGMCLPTYFSQIFLQLMQHSQAQGAGCSESIGAKICRWRTLKISWYMISTSTAALSPQQDMCALKTACPTQHVCTVGCLPCRTCVHCRLPTQLVSIIPWDVFSYLPLVHQLLFCWN